MKARNHYEQPKAVAFGFTLALSLALAAHTPATRAGAQTFPVLGFNQASQTNSTYPYNDISSWIGIPGNNANYGGISLSVSVASGGGINICQYAPNGSSASPPYSVSAVSCQTAVDTGLGTTTAVEFINIPLATTSAPYYALVGTSGGSIYSCPISPNTDTVSFGSSCNQVMSNNGSGAISSLVFDATTNIIYATDAKGGIYASQITSTFGGGPAFTSFAKNSNNSAASGGQVSSMLAATSSGNTLWVTGTASNGASNSVLVCQSSAGATPVCQPLPTIFANNPNFNISNVALATTAVSIGPRNSFYLATANSVWSCSKTNNVGAPGAGIYSSANCNQAYTQSTQSEVITSLSWSPMVIPITQLQSTLKNIRTQWQALKANVKTASGNIKNAKISATVKSDFSQAKTLIAKAKNLKKIATGVAYLKDAYPPLLSALNTLKAQSKNLTSAQMNAAINALQPATANLASIIASYDAGLGSLERWPKGVLMIGGYQSSDSTGSVYAYNPATQEPVFRAFAGSVFENVYGVVSDKSGNVLVSHGENGGGLAFLAVDTNTSFTTAFYGLVPPGTAPASTTTSHAKLWRHIIEGVVAVVVIVGLSVATGGGADTVMTTDLVAENAAKDAGEKGGEMVVKDAGEQAGQSVEESVSEVKPESPEGITNVASSSEDSDVTTEYTNEEKADAIQSVWKTNPDYYGADGNFDIDRVPDDQMARAMKALDIIDEPTLDLLNPDWRMGEAANRLGLGPFFY